MKTRLALVACKDAAQGPWIRSRGNEKAFRIKGIGEGECITAVIEFPGSSETSEKHNSDGTFTLPPSGWSRVRFDKTVGGVQHTHVELLTT